VETVRRYSRSPKLISPQEGGRQLVYQLVVNNVVITRLDEVLQTFQDQGSVSAMLWRDY
jgi:hypothetical protein